MLQVNPHCSIGLRVNVILINSTKISSRYRNRICKWYRRLSRYFATSSCFCAAVPSWQKISVSFDRSMPKVTGVGVASTWGNIDCLSIPDSCRIVCPLAGTKSSDIHQFIDACRYHPCCRSDNSTAHTMACQYYFFVLRINCSNDLISVNIHCYVDRLRGILSVCGQFCLSHKSKATSAS